MDQVHNMGGPLQIQSDLSWYTHVVLGETKFPGLVFDGDHENRVHYDVRPSWNPWTLPISMTPLKNDQIKVKLSFLG